jgi:hypothetical protein
MKILTAPIVVADLDLVKVVLWKKALNSSIAKAPAGDVNALGQLLDFLHALHDAHPDLESTAKAAEALTGEEDQDDLAPDAVDPDFDPMAMRHCAQVGPFTTNVASSSEFGKTYDVQYTAYGKWVCTCPNFQQRGGACSHINKVQSERCDWHQLLHGDVAKAPNYECPKCGGSTYEV